MMGAMMLQLSPPYLVYRSIDEWIDITELNAAADNIVDLVRNSTFRGKLIRALDATSNKYDRPNVSNDDDDDDDHDSDNEMTMMYFSSNCDQYGSCI